MNRRLSISLPNNGTVNATPNSTPTSAQQSAHTIHTTGAPAQMIRQTSQFLQVPNGTPPITVTQPMSQVTTPLSSSPGATVFLPIPESPGPEAQQAGFVDFPTFYTNISGFTDPNLTYQSNSHTANYGSRPKRSASVLSMGASSRRRILAMLDEVRQKRQLRDRRKSDIVTYLDDLMFQEDETAQKGIFKFFRRPKLYQFLNHPSGAPLAIAYHVSVFLIVFVCLILTIIATIPSVEIQNEIITAVYLLEKVVIIWFSIEFLLRLWCCSCKKQYRGISGKFRYLSAPSRIIDLLVLILTTTVLVLNPSVTGHEIFVVSAFRGFHRFFQIAQVLTLNRPLKPWKVLASVIYDQREQLFIILYTEFIVLCALSYLAFLLERDSNQNFNSIADAMWWAIVTLSTVGYGDRVPVTWGGKIVSTCFTILGVAIFALPAGIIGTGLALKIEEEERNQIRNRKKVAAAILIQRTWRCYRAAGKSEIVSTWFRSRPMPIFKQHDFRNMAEKFIALVQFNIARNKFRELMRPIDLKTVVQSYRDGQTEVLLRSKLLHQSVEELGKRLERSEARLLSVTGRLETRQSHYELKIDNLQNILQNCHKQMLDNQALTDAIRRGLESGEFKAPDNIINDQTTVSPLSPTLSSSSSSSSSSSPSSPPSPVTLTMPKETINSTTHVTQDKKEHPPKSSSSQSTSSSSSSSSQKSATKTQEKSVQIADKKRRKSF